MTTPVIAKEKGFYGTLREPGDRFAIAADADLGRWMEVEAQPPEPPPDEDGPPEVEAQPPAKPGKK